MLYPNERSESSHLISLEVALSQLLAPVGCQCTMCTPTNRILKGNMK